LVSLAEARSKESIVVTIAQTLDVPLGEDPEGQLINAIRSRGRLLFILDNFEQIVAFAPQTIGRWLDTNPQAHCIVTSREPLRLEGESLFTLDLLEIPQAITLFIERAQRVKRTFTLTEKSREEIEELVVLLDRLPLAIELAAARSRMLSPKKLLSRMSKRFDVLKTRSRELPRRHQTLQATLEWSWELLNETERSILLQCSAFEGGISIEAAEAIMQGGDTVWLEDVLIELVDKSLLVVGAGKYTGESRLSMLMSVQQFAQEKRADSDEIDARHGAFFAEMGTEDAIHTLQIGRHIERRWTLFEEKDNLIAAAHRAIHREDLLVAERCVLAVASHPPPQELLNEGDEAIVAHRQQCVRCRSNSTS